MFFYFINISKINEILNNQIFLEIISKKKNKKKNNKILKKIKNNRLNLLK